MRLENLEFSEDLEFSGNLRGGTHVRFDKEINFGDVDVDPDIALYVDYSVNIKGFTEYSLSFAPPIIA